jgi:hypothetical protein
MPRQAITSLRSPSGLQRQFAHATTARAKPIADRGLDLGWALQVGQIADAYGAQGAGPLE